MAYPITLPRHSVWRGDPFTLTLRMLDSTGAKIDLSGFGSAWQSQIRTSLAVTSVTASFTIDATNAADATDPRLVLSLSGVTTATLNRGVVYGFDIQATGGAVDPFTVWQGQLAADGDWTHG